MYIKSLIRSYFAVLTVIVLKNIPSCTAESEINTGNYNGRSLFNDVSLSANSPIANKVYERSRRAVVQAPLRLIDERVCHKEKITKRKITIFITLTVSFIEIVHFHFSK